MTLRSLALLASSVALAAACGTTVPVGQQTAVDGLGSANGLGGSGTTSAALPGGSSTDTTTGPTGPQGEASGTGSGNGAQVRTAGGTGGVGSAPSSAAGTVAVDHSPVQVGFFVFKDAGAAFAAFGYKGLSTGDGATEAKTAVALVNSRGGLAGHPIKPVIYEADAATISDQTFQSGCATFFEDNRSLAVVSMTQHPILAACAKAHKAPLVAAGSGSTSQAMLDTFPALVLSSVMTFETIAAHLTDDLVLTRFFRQYGGKPVKVGLITLDGPEYGAIEGVVKAHLAKAGLSLTDYAAMPDADAGTAAAAGRAAAFRFASKGITHVLTVDNNGFGATWFATGAQSNGYYPHYGVSTLNNLAASGSSATAQTLVGAQGIGWSPVIDMPLADQQPLGDHSTTCKNAMAKAGVDMTIAMTHQFAVGLCDAVHLLQAAVKRGDLSVTGFIAGLADMAGFRSAMVFRTDFAASRAAAAGYRSVAYNTGCECFRYTSPVKPL